MLETIVFPRYDDETVSSTYVDCVRIRSVNEHTVPAWASRAAQFIKDMGLRDLQDDDVVVRRRNTGMTTVLTAEIFARCYGR